MLLCFGRLAWIRLVMFLFFSWVLGWFVGGAFDSCCASSCVFVVFFNWVGFVLLCCCFFFCVFLFVFVSGFCVLVVWAFCLVSFVCIVCFFLTFGFVLGLVFLFLF